jgi:hypothetical protein
VSFVPDMNDVKLQILFIIMLVWNLKVKLVNIETAFLYGNLKEKIYMHLIEGLDGEKNMECLSLKKTIYGLFKAPESSARSLVLH